jgi:hypothetical protein
MANNLKELPENPTATEFDEIRKCFHIVMKTTMCPLPSFVIKYIIWLEKLVKSKIQKS